MDLDHFALLVDDMIVQHDYPGFEPRGLNLGLPEDAQRMPAKTYANALGHQSVYVRLAALRWFQERPGLARSYSSAIVGLFDHADEFIRMEAIRTVERFHEVKLEIIQKIALLLKDEHIEVRKAAAKATGKLASRMKLKDPQILEALQEATKDTDPEVRMKVQKAVRLIEA